MKAVLLCCLVYAIAINSFSQERLSDTISLPAVIITSDNNLQSQTLSKVAIQSRGINNSQEILSLVPGLFIGQHAGGGKAEQLFLRGFDADHGTDIHISVDGVPVNLVSHAHGQGYADLHFVIPELVESVHFNKGPYYAEKGDFAIAGYAALNTKNILPSGMLKLEAGRFNSVRGVAMLNLLSAKQKAKHKSLFAAAEVMKTRGYFDQPQNFHRLNFFTRYESPIGERNILNISADYFSSSWMASGQIPLRAVEKGLISFYGAIDPDEGGETKRRSVNARLTTRLDNGVTVRNQLYAVAYDFDLFSNFTFYKLDSVHGDQIRQKEKRILAGYNGGVSSTFFVGNVKLTSDAGVNVRYDVTNGSGLFHTYKRNEVLGKLMEGDIHQLNASIFIKEDLTLTNRLSVGAAVRMDKFYFAYNDLVARKESAKSPHEIVSPKVNVAYQAAHNLQVYVMAGKGFHSNDARVSSYKQERQVLPAAYGVDFGMVWKPAENLFLNGALWYLKADDELLYVGDEGIVEPGGHSKRRGIDLLSRYQPSEKILIDVDVNYAHARFVDETKGNDHIPLAPGFTSTGGMMYSFRRGLSAGIRYRWMKNRPANESYSVIAKGYFINDVVVSYAVKKYEIKLSAANIFNVKWRETQFDTESRLRSEPFPVSEIHFTAGTPLFIKAGFTWYLKSE